MNRTKIIGALFLAMISTTGFSQYFRLGKVNEVKEVKSRPAVILMEEEDPKVLKKLSGKPGELAEYKEEIKKTNEELTAVVSQLWSFSATPTTKTRSEIEKLKDDKNKQFAVITLNQVRHIVTVGNGDGFSRSTYSSKVVATLAIDLIEDLGKGNAVFYQNLPNEYPTRGDIALGIQLMQNFMQARLDGKKRGEISDEADENKSLLSGKTLLLDKEDLKNGLTPAQIKGAYPYKVKIVSYSEIEAAILERNKDFAVVQIIPMSVGVPANAHIVMSTADGKSLAYYAPIQASTLGGKNTEARISERHLKNYAK